MSTKRPLYIACLAVFMLFIGLRFAALTQRPLHHDEGVNTFFLRNLVTANNYKYDPKNYHGPNLYYFQLPITWVGTLLKNGPAKFSFKSDVGITAVTVRFMVALAGCLLLALLLFSRPVMGLWGSLTAFALVGLSCDFIFLSRYFIHEIFLVLFTYGFVWGAFYFLERKHPAFLYVMGVSAVLAYCTKETSIFVPVILFLAALLTPVVRRWADPMAPEPVSKIVFDVRAHNTTLRNHLPLIFLISAALWALFFSSFFKNPQGLIDSVRTYFYWGQEGLESGHAKRFLYFINDIIIRYELAIFILAFLGIIIALIKNESKGIFLSLWTLGTVALYSLIPYKTPWLIINMLLPMAVVAGYGIQALIDLIDSQPQDSQKTYRKLVVGSGVVLLLAIQIPQTWRVNYVEYDSDKHPQIYGHTVRDVYNLVEEVDAMAKKSGLGLNIPIEVVSGEYWPLPFYFMKYPSAHFWGKMEGVSLNSPLILGENKQKAKLAETLKNTHVIKQFNLRPGLPLQLYIHHTLVEKVNVPRMDPLPAQNATGPMAPGLVLETYQGVNFTGRPQSVKPGNSSFDFWWDVDTQKPAKPPFSFWWKGFLKAEKPGVYDFSLESDDGSWLLIDDQLIVDNGGVHGVQKATNRVNLSTGMHKFELKYFDQGGGAVLKPVWMIPGSNRDAPLTQAPLYHTPPKN